MQLMTTSEINPAPYQDNKQAQPHHQNLPANNWTDTAWHAKHELVYNCQLSNRYHKKRERFLSNSDNLATALSLMAGASIVSSFLGAYNTHFGFFVVAVTTLQLVVSFKEKSKLHATLAADFKRLEADIEKAGCLNDYELSALHAAYLSIESSEPPTLGLLVQICQNELASAANQPEKINQISWLRKLSAQFLDWPKKFEAS